MCQFQKKQLSCLHVKVKANAAGACESLAQRFLMLSPSVLRDCLRLEKVKSALEEEKRLDHGLNTNLQENHENCWNETAKKHQAKELKQQ